MSSKPNNNMNYTICGPFTNFKPGFEFVKQRKTNITNSDLIDRQLKYMSVVLLTNGFNLGATNWLRIVSMQFGQLQYTSIISLTLIVFSEVKKESQLAAVFFYLENVTSHHYIFTNIIRIK